MKICHTRGIIVGCAGAGKTTLLMRLQDVPYEEIKKIKTTEIVDVHVNSFKVLEELTTIKGKLHIYFIHPTYYCTLLLLNFKLRFITCIFCLVILITLGMKNSKLP